MDRLTAIVDVQGSRDEISNSLLTLPLDDLSGLRLCLFEEAKSRSLAHSNDVLVNRRGSALRPKSFAIVSDIITLAASIQDHKSIPRVLVKNGKRSEQDLSTWRSSDRCQKEVTAAANVAQSYSQRSASPSMNERSTPIPLPPAQSIASSVITKDLNSLKMEVDELKLRMNTLEKFSNPGVVKSELEQIKSSILDLAHMPIKKTTAVTQSIQTTLSPTHLPVNQPPLYATHTINIAAWNCRGLSQGLPYIEHLADGHDVIIISEHWLWPFELHNIKTSTQT